MSLESEAAQAMSMVFDTFKRTNSVTFYKTPAQEIIVQDSEYNADFWNPYNTGVTETASGQSGTYECRVIWPRAQEVAKMFGDDVKLSAPKGVVRIQMETGAYDFFQDTKAVFVEGEKYVQHGDLRRLGVFSSYNCFEFVGIKDT